jgi:hypothetical protein
VYWERSIPHTLTVAGDLAASLSGQGKHAEAEQIQREVLGVTRRVLGEEHPDTLTVAIHLGATLAYRAKFAEAEEMLHATLEACRRVLGNTHPDTLAAAKWLEHVRSAMRVEQPTGTGGKAAARRDERAAAPALSPTALVEAEARARAAEAELLAMLDLEGLEAAAPVGGGSGSAKGKAKGKAKDEGGTTRKQALGRAFQRLAGQLEVQVQVPNPESEFEARPPAERSVVEGTWFPYHPPAAPRSIKSEPGHSAARALASATVTVTVTVFFGKQFH